MFRLMFHLLLLISTLTPRAFAQIKPVDFVLPDGFVAEQVYEVPNSKQGSWICLTTDDRGRLITSDQKGSLYRLTVPESSNGSSAKNAVSMVEKIDLDIGMAMGLLYFGDSLYVMVNGASASGPGLYRVRDTDQDDKFDSVELLRGIEPPGNPGAGHGNHAIVPSPDGQSLYIVCGNMAGKPVDGFDSSRVPMHWDEDQLLPRLADSGGHASNTMAPGGWIAKTDLDGKHWELVCIGFRNIYDAAFNRDGDLFTYDADMEFDLGTPWYRPTRVCQVVSGGEFGWRNGSGKWPDYYPDSLPAAIDIGLGSPTGITFGYETNFPEPYRESLFLCDWSYGRIYTTDLKRSGASYEGKNQLFASFAPLPVVDLVVHPRDHSLYLVTGGRGVQSHIYRIRYQGNEALDSISSSMPSRKGYADILRDETDDLHAVRRSMEEFHVPSDRSAIERIWPNLSHDDRFIRYAARIALEHQPVEHWQTRLAVEKDASTIISASIALSRCADQVSPQLLDKLLELPNQNLTPERRVDLLRALGLVFLRHGRPTDLVATQLSESLRPRYPSKHAAERREQSRMLAYLGDVESIEPMLKELETLEAPDDQMHLALVLRNFKDGWTNDQRRRYFEWFRRADDFIGGRKGGDFARQIRKDAEATLDNEVKEQLQDLLDSAGNRTNEELLTDTRPVVKKWTLEDLIPEGELTWSKIHAMETDAERGKQMFSVAMCNRCHQVRGQGGRVGPNLSGATRRFSPRDLLEAILDPSKTIPHEFQGVKILTEDGKVVVGQVVNYGGGGMSVRTDPMVPWRLTKIDSNTVERITPSTTSLMPAGLLDTLHKEEIFDLLQWMAEQ